MWDVYNFSIVNNALKLYLQNLQIKYINAKTLKYTEVKEENRKETGVKRLSYEMRSNFFIEIFLVRQYNNIINTITTRIDIDFL